MSQARTVLLVEDDILLRATIRTIIEYRLPAWQLMEAANGAEGITLVQHCRPDVILLDYQMPVMNGYEMALALKRAETTRSIPLVLNSSTDRNEPQVAALSDLCTAILDKSEIFQQLADVLIRVVNVTAP